MELAPSRGSALSRAFGLPPGAGPLWSGMRDLCGCRPGRSRSRPRHGFAMTQTPPDAPITREVRQQAREQIRDHAREEAARSGRLSRVREFVLGAQDGLLVPLEVVTGMAAANPGRGPILVAGIAEAVAGCAARGRGSYLASEAEEGLYAAEIADEGREIIEEPAREVAELALVLEDEGLPRDAADRVARDLATNPTVFLRTKVQKRSEE